MDLEKAADIFRSSPHQTGKQPQTVAEAGTRPASSPIATSSVAVPPSHPPTTPSNRKEEENFTPLRYDQPHPLPSAGKGAESLLPSPAHHGTFNGGITYATPLVRRKGGEGGGAKGSGEKRPSSPGRVAAEAAAAAAAHQHHYYHQYNGPPSPAAGENQRPPYSSYAQQPHSSHPHKFAPHTGSYPPYPAHGYAPNFAPAPFTGHPMQVNAAATAAAATNTTSKKRKTSGGGGTSKKNGKNKDTRRKKLYSDYVGVTYNKTHAKYQACITHYRKQHYLGRYRLAVDAARAYDESAKLLKGSGWKINFGSAEEYERAKAKEIERLEEIEEEERLAAETALENGIKPDSGSGKKRKTITARSLANVAVKIQVPQSVYTVVANANGAAAAQAAQAQVAAANEAAVRQVEINKAMRLNGGVNSREITPSSSTAPTSHLPYAQAYPPHAYPPHAYVAPAPSRHHTELPSKTPINAAGRSANQITPSPFNLSGNAKSDGDSSDITCTPSAGNKANQDQGGADIAATCDSTPHSELRPTKIADRTVVNAGTETKDESRDTVVITPTDSESSSSVSQGQGKSSCSPKTPAGATGGPKARPSEVVTPQEAAASALMTLIGQ